MLERPGAEDVRKSIHMHISFGLFAGILGELAATVGRIPKDDILHRDQLTEAVAQLHQALTRSLSARRNIRWCRQAAGNKGFFQLSVLIRVSRDTDERPASCRPFFVSLELWLSTASGWPPGGLRSSDLVTAFYSNAV